MLCSDIVTHLRSLPTYGTMRPHHQRPIGAESSFTMATYVPHSSINLSLHNVVSCEVKRRNIPSSDQQNIYSPSFEAFELTIRDAHGTVHNINMFGLANLETRERCTPIQLTVKEEPIPV
jgi:hypothetical protein